MWVKNFSILLSFTLCDSLLSVYATITTNMYHNDQAYTNILVCVSIVIQRKILDRVINSLIFGVMVDESTNIIVLGHLVVFVIFLKDGVLI